MDTIQPEPLRDELAVEEANERFYQALENADLELMEAVWLHAESVTCVHPGWELLTGWDNVCESWRRIFEGTQGMRVRASDISVHIEDDFAWVTCHENLALFLDRSTAPASAVTVATNLFRRFDDEWLMVHHHASQTPTETLISESDKIQ